MRHSLSQLSAVLVKHESPDRWPALLDLLNQSTSCNNPHDRQVAHLSLPLDVHHYILQLLVGDLLKAH